MKVKYNNSKSTADIFLVLLAVLFVSVIIGLVGFIIYKINNPTIEIQDDFDPNAVTISQEGQKLKTIEEILEKYRVILIENTGVKIYVEFPNGYYDDNGKSYSSYFYNLLDEISELDAYKYRSYFLIDENKGMEIEARYSRETQKHIYIFNDLEDFYKVTDGKTYSQIENASIVKEQYAAIVTDETKILIGTNFFVKNIKNRLGEPTGQHGEYNVYKDGAILARIVNGKVRNLIYTEDYDQPVVNRYKVGTDLETIYKTYGSAATQGSPQEHYLLYRTEYTYNFIYDNEVSIWPFTYEVDQPFESYVKEYVEDRDLEKFYNKVTNRWTNYLRNEVDFEFGEVHLSYPSMGVMIDIRGNDPAGIKIYNNCCFSTDIKNLLRNKVLTFVNEDALINAEQERRATF